MFEEANLLSYFFSFVDVDEEELFPLIDLKNGWKVSAKSKRIKELKESILHIEDWTKIKPVKLKYHKQVQNNAFSLFFLN